MAQQSGFFDRFMHSLMPEHDSVLNVLKSEKEREDGPAVDIGKYSVKYSCTELNFDIC